MGVRAGLLSITMVFDDKVMTTRLLTAGFEDYRDAKQKRARLKGGRYIDPTPPQMGGVAPSKFAGHD